MDKKIPEGQILSKWMAVGVAIGLPLGLPFSINNPGLIGIGLPIGLTIGIAIGTQKEKEAKEKGLLRPLTKEEKARKKKFVWITLALLIVGVIAGVTTFFLSR